MSDHNGVTLRMIEALKDDAVLSKFGGRFKLCVLVQTRLRDLMDGARPLVEREGRSDLELVFEEIIQDKITLTHANGGGDDPDSRE